VMSKNRQERLAHLVAYYSRYPVHLIIADGSDLALTSRQQKKFSSGIEYDEGFRWSYIHEPRPSSYVDRMSRALSLTESLYVALAPDDELLIWSGVVDSLKALEENASMSSAGGATTLCRKFGHNIAFTNYLSYGFPIGDKFCAQHWIELGIGDDSASNRVREVIKKSLWTRFHFYRVFKKQALNQAVSLWKATNLDLESGLLELLLSLGSHISGKSTFFDKPFVLRSLQSSTGASTNFGYYSDYDLQAIAQSVVNSIGELCNYNVQEEITQPELIRLLRREYGPGTKVRETIYEYSVRHKKRKFQKTMRRRLEAFMPSLTMMLVNHSLVSRDKFKFTKHFPFEFFQSRPSEAYVGDFFRAVHTIKFLS